MKRQRRILIWVGILVAVIAIEAIGQPCTSFGGILVDASTGGPLPGAHVRVAGKPGGTSTSGMGDFEIKAMTGDTLLITFTGYATRRIVLDSLCHQSVSLEPSSNELNTVVIKAERLIAEEFTIRKIMRLDIYTNPSAKADPILAVNSAPSATTTDESANISLRGSSPAETGIFFNNVPINDAVRYGQLNGIGTFSIFNTALVSQVHVYPGNPPLEFGSTTSGLIALTSDETIPERPINTISLTLASFGAYTQRTIGKRSSLISFFNYQPSVLIKALNPRALERITSFNSVDFGLHCIVKPSDKTIFKLFTYGIRETYQYYYKHPTYQGNFEQQKNRMYMVINFRKRYTHSEFSINNGISFSYANFAASSMDVNIHQRDFYGAVNYQYFGGKATFKTGLSYDTRYARFQGKYPVYPYAFGEAYPSDSSASEQRFKIPEAYIYGKYFLAPRITLGGGLRKNLRIDDSQDFLSYQLNVSLQLLKPLTINLSAGRYNKYQLPLGEAESPFHIEADQYSLDAGWKKGDTEYSLSVFYKKSRYTQTRSVVSGVELFAKYRLSPRLRGQLSLTSLDADLTQGPSPYNISYFLRGNFEYRFADTWTTTAVFLFREGSYFVPVTSAAFDSALGVFAPQYGNPQRLPSYSMADLSISKIFVIGENSGIAFAGINNLFDFSNVRGYSYNFDYSHAEEDLFSLRTIYLGFVYNF